MTMMINSDTKIAIAQFGNPDDAELKEMAQAASEKGIHWYYFDKTPRLATIKNKIEKKYTEPRTKAMIVLVDNQPMGYIQSYPVDGNGNWTKQVKVAENMVSIDYFIGDLNYIHKGLGPKMILEYIEQIIKKEGYSVAMISPDPENIANCKCVEKCGFKYVKTVNVPYSNSKEKEAVYIKEI